jgi:hypothetical protein
LLLLSLSRVTGHSAMASAQDDSRKTYRYPAVGSDARLGWWVGADFREVSARVEDISQGGVLIVSEEVPPPTKVYLRLARPTATDWVLIQVLRTVVISEGKCRIGATFPESCPYELFKDSRGFLLKARDEVRSPEFDGRFWR